MVERLRGFQFPSSQLKLLGWVLPFSQLQELESNCNVRLRLGLTNIKKCRIFITWSPFFFNRFAKLQIALCLKRVNYFDQYGVERKAGVVGS